MRLRNPQFFADTELSDGIKRHGMVSILKAAISRKRRNDGEPLGNILAALLVWPLLKVSSIHCFCSDALPFLQGRLEGSKVRSKFRQPESAQHSLLLPWPRGRQLAGAGGNFIPECGSCQ